MQKICLNTGWRFFNYQTNESLIVNVPHDATICAERDPNIRNGWLSAYYYGGKYRYEKTIYISKQQQNQSIYIQFEGVYRNSTIYVNNILVHTLVNGYVGFNIAIDQFAIYGADNIIRVEIDTPLLDHTRWYMGSGIYREANLYFGNKTHIAPNGIKVTTLSYLPAKIKIETQSSNEINSADVLVEIYDGDIKVAQAYGLNAEIEITLAKLWCDKSPYLYVARVTFFSDGKVLDCAETNFGVRVIEVDAKNGLRINGVSTILRGGCIHSDNGILGMITTNATERRRVKNIKMAGFNAIRIAHHPASRALLDACDEFGLFVMDEAFDSWYRMKTRNDFSSAFYTEYLDILRLMISNCYNHPSVIMYSIGNEIPETGSLKAKRFAQEIIAQVRACDKTRPITICPSMRIAKDFIFSTPFAEVDEDEYLNSDERKKEDFEHYVKVWTRGLYNLLDFDEYTPERSYQDERVMSGLYENLDIAGFNYYGEYYENLHKKHPDWVICGTETEGNKLKFHHDLMQKHKYIIGDFVWTLQDHLGEVNCSDMHFGKEKGGGKEFPWLSNYSGVLDLHGNPYFSLHKYKIIWGQEKGLFIGTQPPITDGKVPLFNNYKETDVVESWSFDGCEGNNTYVDIITDAAVAEVFINGQSLGRQEVENYTARFFCTYNPGEVLAIGYDKSGNQIYTNLLKTAGKDTFLTVDVDKTVLVDMLDFCFVDIKITDLDGVVKMLPNRNVLIDVSGAGELAGFGSAAYKNIEKFNQNNHMSYNGRVMAAIRGSNKSGEICVTVSTEHAQPQTIIIHNNLLNK